MGVSPIQVNGIYFCVNIRQAVGLQVTSFPTAVCRQLLSIFPLGSGSAVSHTLLSPPPPISAEPKTTVSQAPFLKSSFPWIYRQPWWFWKKLTWTNSQNEPPHSINSKQKLTKMRTILKIKHFKEMELSPILFGEPTAQPCAYLSRAISPAEFNRTWRSYPQFLCRIKLSWDALPATLLIFRSKCSTGFCEA